MSLDEIENKFSLITEKVVETTIPVAESFAKGDFKLTGRALLAFVPKSGYLTNAILHECRNGNLYSSFVLFRSLIEHNFRHLYIYTKSLKDRDDSVGKAYYSLLRGNEDLRAFKKSNNFLSKILPGFTRWSTNSDNNRKLEEAAQDFEISNIFDYLIKNNGIKDETFVKYQKDYLSGRINEYSSLSSVVHGGPFGEKLHEEYIKNKAAFEKKLIDMAAEGFALHKSLIETTYLFASLMDDGCQKYYDDIKQQDA